MKLSSLTYLSFNLERLVMHSTADLQSPFITVSVHDSRGRKVSLPALYLYAPCTFPAGSVSDLTGMRLSERLQSLHSGYTLEGVFSHGACMTGCQV